MYCCLSFWTIKAREGKLEELAEREAEDENNFNPIPDPGAMEVGMEDFGGAEDDDVDNEGGVGFDCAYGVEDRPGKQNFHLLHISFFLTTSKSIKRNDFCFTLCRVPLKEDHLI